MYRSNSSSKWSASKPTLLAAALVGSTLGGCYSDKWIADLAAETEGDTGTSGDCDAGDLQCSEQGVLRCVDGSWAPDRSNIGCDFVAATLPMEDVDGVQVVLGLANAGLRPANVELTVGGTSVGAIQVMPGAAAQLTLPWNAALGDPSSSATVVDGGILVTSDEPVAAFMVNRGDAASRTSDAATLLPRHVWGDEYYALTNPHFVSPLNGDQGSGFWAAVAHDQPVGVMATGGPAASLAPGGGLDANGSGGAGLGPGGALVAVTASSGVDAFACGWNPGANYYGCGRPPVAEPSGSAPLVCAATPAEGTACSGTEAFIGCCGDDGAAYYCDAVDAGAWVREACPPLSDGSDLSGSRVRGDKPFAFFAGHSCTNIPAYEPYCDHLEEQLWPSNKAGRRFPVVAPSFDGVPKSYLLRILALEGPVQLGFMPPLAGAPSSIATTGEYVDIWVAADVVSTADFVVEADGAIMVMQMSLGDDGGFGDPAMLLTPSFEQGMTHMPFFVPGGFNSASVTLVGPPGTTVEVDGSPITLMAPLTANEAYVRAALQPSPNGYHQVRSPVPVVASVFARNASPDPNTTLWYPAGVADPSGPPPN